VLVEILSALPSPSPTAVVGGRESTTAVFAGLKDLVTLVLPVLTAFLGFVFAQRVEDRRSRREGDRAVSERRRAAFVRVLDAHDTVMQTGATSKREEAQSLMRLRSAGQRLEMEYDGADAFAVQTWLTFRLNRFATAAMRHDVKQIGDASAPLTAGLIQLHQGMAPLLLLNTLPGAHAPDPEPEEQPETPT
jgi:hypothetical protein